MASDSNLTRYITRFTRRPVIRWIAVIYTVLVIMTAVYSFVEITGERRIASEHTLMERLHEVSKKLEILETKVGSIHGVAQIDAKKLESISKTISEFRQLKDSEAYSVFPRLSKVEEGLIRLQSALDLTKPEEILSVLRLLDKFELFGDKLQDFRQKFDELREEARKEIENNKSQMLRHVETIQWSVGLLTATFAAIGVPILITIVVKLFFPQRDAD